ncbi:MAG: hypothetical protein LBE78_04775 [Burkholderiaceae bacterium]|jgi:hypothetical protein|nr:hypothetical protein [Burkholderiaceae bacterium]
MKRSLPFSLPALLCLIALPFASFTPLAAAQSFQDCDYGQKIGSCSASISVTPTGDQQGLYGADLMIHTSAQSCARVEYFVDNTPVRTALPRGGSVDDRVVGTSQTPFTADRVQVQQCDVYAQKSESQDNQQADSGGGGDSGFNSIEDMFSNAARGNYDPSADRASLESALDSANAYSGGGDSGMMNMMMGVMQGMQGLQQQQMMRVQAAQAQAAAARAAAAAAAAAAARNQGGGSGWSSGGGSGGGGGGAERERCNQAAGHSCAQR